MKKFDLCGLGNAILDILIKVSDEELEASGYKKSTTCLVEADKQKALLDMFKDKISAKCGGGSVANSIVAARQLGSSCAFISLYGDDEYGKFYQEDFSDIGVVAPSTTKGGAANGTCVSLVTPDAERTMVTHLGCGSSLGPEHIPVEVIQGSKCLLIEGYMLANPENTWLAIKAAMQAAMASGVKIAFTASEVFVVEFFRERVLEVVSNSDFLFCNEKEALKLGSAETLEAALKNLGSMARNFVVTLGEKGSTARIDGEVFETPAYPCRPLDLTGAGDTFCGSFLSCVLRGMSPQNSARAASLLAREVITSFGARLRAQPAKILMSEFGGNFLTGTV